MKRLVILGSLLLAVTILAGTASAASAPAAATDPAAKFYHDKVIIINTQSPPGSVADLWARTLSFYLPELTGAKVAVQNNPGGGGRVIENSFATTVKPDGLNLMISLSGTLWPPFMTGDPAVKYDITKYQYVGGAEGGNSFLCVSPKGKIKTIDDLRKTKGLKFSASNKNSLVTYANALAISILGLDGKIITGFQGVAGRQLAVQQGEVEGIVAGSDATFLAAKSGILAPLFQIGTKRTKPGEEFPCMMELVKANTLNDTQKRLIGSIDILADAMICFASPGVPQDRMAFLSNAFKKTVDNPAFRAAITKSTGEEVPPYLSGEAIGKIARDLAAKKTDMKLWDELLNQYVK